jgi:hypothetical protein
MLNDLAQDQMQYAREVAQAEAAYGSAPTGTAFAPPNLPPRRDVRVWSPTLERAVSHQIMSAVSTKSNNIKSAVSENVKNFSSYRTHTREIDDTSLIVGTKPT